MNIWTNFNLSLFPKAFIAYDRYNTIARPMDGKLSITKALIMVSFIWFYT
jgi:r-opsin